MLGESVTEATLGKWYKSVGDAVAVDEVICELETDKVALEVNATSAGAISEILVAEGENVEVGALLAKIDETAHGKSSSSSEKPPTTPKTESSAKSAPKKEDKPKKADVKSDVKAKVKTDGSNVRPAAAKLAAEKNIYLSTLIKK